jgi:putative transposase
LVFTTKYRRGAIGTDRVRDLLKEVMTSVAADMGAKIDAVEADGDHVHILLSYPPQLALSRLVNSLKGVSARRLRQQGWPEVRRVLWGDHFWSPSYCVVSCGGAPLEIVKAYVETQNDPDRARKGAAIRAANKKRKHQVKKEGALTPH